jgi:hypothetical protein
MELICVDMLIFFQTSFKRTLSSTQIPGNTVPVSR